jgi:guanylate kinase
MTEGKLIVLTGPSGVGKGTILRSLISRHPQLYLSISTTTRPPRTGETDGKDYYFRTHSQFKEMIIANQLLEWAEYAGNYYGTPRLQVEKQIAEGKWVILEIELEGARQIQTTFPSAFRIFILPPSLTELEERIKERGENSTADIERRLKRANIEISAANEFDVQIVNEDLETAIEQVESAIFHS